MAIHAASPASDRFRRRESHAIGPGLSYPDSDRSRPACLVLPELRRLKLRLMGRFQPVFENKLSGLFTRGAETKEA